MTEKEEFSFIARDGIQILGWEWQVPKPKAAICLVHGLGEHAGRYDHVADFFVENEISFFVMDLRGHGLSEGKRGHTPSLERLVDDVEECLMYIRSEYNELPVFLYGHSLGGNIVTNYLLTKNTNELVGAIISSPWLRAKNEPSNLEIKLARFVNRFYPSLTQSNRLKTEDLTNIAEVNQAYDDDPLVHDRISVRLFVDCYDAGRWALDNVSLLKVPVYMFHGSADNITDPNPSQEFAKSAGDLADYNLWEGTKHEPHNDLDKEKVLESVLKWVNDKL